MDDRELRTAVISLLQRIAPEVEADALDGAAPLREQVDLDSMDFLNFLISLHTRFAVSIPEADYERLRSLDDIVAYLGSRATPA
jgi:acyl carrier protein